MYHISKLLIEKYMCTYVCIRSIHAYAHIYFIKIITFYIITKKYNYMQFDLRNCLN